MRKIIIITLVAAFIPAVYINAQNPFVEKSKKKDRGSDAGLIKNKFIKKIIVWQGKLNRQLGEKIESFKYDKSPGVFFLIVFICFAYGALHALGPGHGKTVISAWVVASRKKFRSVAAASVFSAVFHALSAVILISAAYIILKKTISGSEGKFRETLQFAAGIMIFAIGIYMMVKHLLKRNKAGERGRLRENNDVHPLLLAAGVGIVPCPATSVILIFSFTFGLVLEGLVFVLFFAAGMALTQVAIAGGVWHIREKAEDLKTGKTMVFFERVLPITGAAVLMLLGGFIILPYLY